MKMDRQIDKIIENYHPDISSGRETIDSILEKYPQYNHELRTRLEAVFWLAQARYNLQPRHGFIASSRKYIENQFETIQPPGFWHRISRQFTPQRWVFNFTASVVMILLLVFIVNSIILSARLSLPGDPFYSTKLFMEDMQLAFTFNQVDKTNLYFQLTRERAMEFIELVMEGNYEYLPPTATRMEAELISSLYALNDISKKGPDEDGPVIGNLRDTLSSEIFILNALKSTSPAYAMSGIEMAIQAAQSGLFGLY